MWLFFNNNLLNYVCSYANYDNCDIPKASWEGVLTKQLIVSETHSKKGPNKFKARKCGLTIVRRPLAASGQLS